MAKMVKNNQNKTKLPMPQNKMQPLILVLRAL